MLLYRSTFPNMDDENEEKRLSYGWLQIRPRWLQFLNTPKWFLFFLSQYFFTQSIVVNGIFPGSISTIEKRFGFTRLVNKVSSFTSGFYHLYLDHIKSIKDHRKKMLSSKVNVQNAKPFFIPHQSDQSHKISVVCKDQAWN